MSKDPKSTEPLGVFGKIIKALPRGGGWEPIPHPRGGAAGFRRKRGAKWEYYYPGKLDLRKRKRKPKKVEGRSKLASLQRLFAPMGVQTFPQPGEQFEILSKKDSATKPVFRWYDKSVSRWKYGYTEKFRRASDSAKWDKVSEIIPRLTGLRRALSMRMANERFTMQQRDAACVLSIISQTGLRVGHEKHKKVSGTVGALTIGPENVKINGDRVEIHFVGKMGQENRSAIRNPAVARHIMAKLATPGIDRLFPVGANDLDRMMSDLGYKGFTPKDLRGAVATIAAVDALAGLSAPPPPMPKDKGAAMALVRDKVTEASEKVARVLNNTPKAASESYIHPAVIYGWLTDVGGARLASDIFKATEDTLDLVSSEKAARILLLALRHKPSGPRASADHEKPDLPEELEASLMPEALKQ